jgi:hypothetical protein
MGILDQAVPVSEIKHGNFWVLYGRSGSGKTHLLSTFPKPLLYVQIGDDGTNTIDPNEEDIRVLSIDNIAQLELVAKELEKDRFYATVGVDTFSLLVNEWIDQEAVQKKRRVTQQMWGDLKTDTEKYVKMFQRLSKDRIIVLTCHEVGESFEGMEDEIMPDIRPSVSKGARTYLEGMANYGIHCTVIQKDKEMPDGTTKTIDVHAIHLAPNPYYWVKTQKPASIKLPELVINPSYDKIMRLIKGEATTKKKKKK